MSRKSWICIFAVMAAMVIVMVVGTHVLYRKDSRTFKPVDERYGLAYAVPANAVAVFFFSEAENISSPVFSSFDFPKKLSDFLQSGKAEDIAQNRMALSLHYAGALAPLYVIDAGPVSDTPSSGVDSLIRFVQDNGFTAEFVNCAKLSQDSPLASRSIVLISNTNSQIKVSKRHLAEGSSFMDVSGFREAAATAPENVLFLSYDYARALFEKVVSREIFVKRFEDKASAAYSQMASFFTTFADWGVMDLSDPDCFTFVQQFSEASDFMDVLDHDSPSVARVSEMLPFHTRFSLTLPMGGTSSYIGSYEAYLETVRRWGVVMDWQESLRKKTHVKPLDFVNRLGVSEVATASFKVGENIERVNLIRIQNADPLLLSGTGLQKFTSSPAVMPYAFSEYIASVFGSFFNLADESFFTVMNGWLITGSEAVVKEYVQGDALKYTLKTYMADAGKTDLLTERLASCVVYLDMPEADPHFADVLRKPMLDLYDDMRAGADYAPIVMSVFKKDGVMHTDIIPYHLQMRKLRPEQFMKETSVVIPTGPFEVINSGTGRTNLFYQQPNGAICLKELDGKGIWGVPFKHTLCGTAQNVDYYDNGNLQILFGAGSSIYVIDRKGAFVYGFPKDLGKDILLGPGLYEVNDGQRYALMVLHQDNTLEMYDMNGRKPSLWKGIRSTDVIRGLPEMIKFGDSCFWVVRTSIQTLIYPFYGGQPLTDFRDEKMILPTSEVNVDSFGNVELECYDGQKRTVRLQ